MCTSVVFAVILHLVMSKSVKNVLNIFRMSVFDDHLRDRCVVEMTNYALP